MVRGCDVWLNLPRPPLEASGTSGMKSVVNGGLQLSVLDGWWAEAYDGENGWALPGEEDPDHGAQDQRDGTELHRLLEDEVALAQDERPGVLGDAHAARLRGASLPGLITWPEAAGRPSKSPGTRWLSQLLVERSAAERAAGPVSDALSEPQSQAAQATDPRHADLLSPERARDWHAARRSGPSCTKSSRQPRRSPQALTLSGRRRGRSRPARARASAPPPCPRRSRPTRGCSCAGSPGTRA